MNKGRSRERAEMLVELKKSVVDEPANELEQEEQETIFIEFSNLKVSAGVGEPMIDDSYPDFIKVKKVSLPKTLILLLKSTEKA
ncbi:MAG TPA: hypothetical protein RWO09_03675 [Ruminococcus sp.]